jgi:hypothetical protein
MKLYFRNRLSIKKFFFNRFSILTILTYLPYFLSSFAYAQDQETNDLLKKISEDIYLLNDLEINTSNRTVIIPCNVNMTSGLIEVLLCCPEGKVHESLLTTRVSPLEFQTALLLLGLDPVNEIPDDPSKADPLSSYKTIETLGDSLLLFLETEKEGKVIREPIETFIRDERTKSSVSHVTWLFKGAVTHQSGHVLVDPNVTIISTYIDPVSLMELNASSKFNDELFYVNEAAKLTKGQSVKLILQAL